MAHVNVTIGGRLYRMSCDDGQEDHLRTLGEDFDKRVSDLKDKFGEIGDTRLTVMAALTLADELFDSTQRVQALERQLTAFRAIGTSAADRDELMQAAVVAALDAASERIERVTKSLNKSLTDSVPMG
jgi:cell division protein ZapA